MDAGFLDIVLGSGDVNPFVQHSDDFTQALAVQGFLKIHLGAESDLLTKAVGEVDSLDSAKKLYAPAEVLVEGLLGDEGSTRIVEVSSFDDDTRSLEILNQAMEAVAESMRHYLSGCGFEACEKTPLLVHRGGLDMAVPIDMSAEESMKFMSIFGRHILMFLLFLGPGEGTLELQPFDAEADVEEIRTKPGILVVLRPDLLSHKHIPDGDDSVLSCWMLAPSNPSSRSSQTLLLQTPIVQELDQFTQQKFLEVKARVDADEEPTEKIPLAMQMEMNRRFFSGCRAAVRGMGIRLPGASFAETFWNSLGSGTDYVVNVPTARWDHSKFYNPEPESYETRDAMGRHYTTSIQHASFIEGVEMFDHKFFGLSPAEAKGTSPDQRLVLECAYEAMHEYGYTKQTLTKSNAYLGVFMATGVIDWGLTEKCAEASGGALGGTTVSAARTSFCLGMRGPCIAFDNEGASSLITTVLAVQSVVPSNDRWSMSGMDCPASLCGASKILTNPSQWPRYNYWMCPTGRSFVFDENARGFVKGEGVVMLCLSSLTQKVDGKHVIQKDADRGSICGWRVNSNGMNATMTAPSGSQQQECISMAIRQAGINAWDIDAVETHGSAMQLDDAIEVTSLGLCLRGAEEVWNETLQVSSIKTNVGNQVEVTGVTALVKVAYGQSYLCNVPHLHLRTLNPNIDLDDSMPLLMQTEAMPYRALSSYHGVTALSQNGTNCHVIMWGNVDDSKVSVTAKVVVAQDLCYWPGGGGQLQAGAKAVIGYFITGSWNGWEPCQMTEDDSGLFIYTVVIGENRFEEFQIWVDGDQGRALCPGAAQAVHGSAVYGPVQWDEGTTWMIDGTNPGDRYEISLKIAGKFRAVTWQKVHTAQHNEMQLSLSGSYYVAGEANGWELQEMERSEDTPGLFTVDVGPLAPARNSFYIVRNRDWSQTFHASATKGEVYGPGAFDAYASNFPFELHGGMGSTFRIQFRRVIDVGVDKMTISWERVSREAWPRPLT